jgi:hypothetical protein
VNISQVLKSSQEQASAAWIDYLNQLRLNELLSKLAAQDVNLKSALQELQNVKTILAEQIIGKNRGGTKGMHGFIAEPTQVAIKNARDLVMGNPAKCIWVNDNGPVDLLYDGIPIQQKFSQSLFSLNAIKEHMAQYPDYLHNGGKYQIPKDYYETISKLLSLNPADAQKLANNGEVSDLTYRNWKKVQDFFQANNISPDNIEPAVMDYADVQPGNIGKTLASEESSIRETDRSIRDNAYQQSKPSVNEGMQATAVSAALEGGMNFCLGVAKKLKAGKHLNEFTVEDWKDVGISTTKGTATGAIRGAAVYSMTNFTATPAAVANALVTAAFGIATQAHQLRQGNISEEDFIVNSEVLCLDVSVSAVASILGQALIPIPVLGAIIGNTVGMFMYGIAKEHLSSEEQSMIADFQGSMEQLNKRLDERYQALLSKLQEAFARFSSILELAFDPDINIAFAGSISLADNVGVPEDRILKSKSDIDNYFMN